MIFFLLVVMYFCVGVVCAGVFRDEIGAHDAGGGAIILLVWPLFLMITIIVGVLKLLGYKVK